MIVLKIFDISQIWIDNKFSFNLYKQIVNQWKIILLTNDREEQMILCMGSGLSQSYVGLSHMWF